MKRSALVAVRWVATSTVALLAVVAMARAQESPAPSGVAQEPPAAPSAGNAPSSADEAQRAAQEKEARQKLALIRAELAVLAEQRRARSGERSAAQVALEDKERELAAVARDVHALDERLQAEQARLGDLVGERRRIDAALGDQRATLASLLRSAYALGRNEELKLLLQQDDVAKIARVLAYNRYVQRARVARIGQLDADRARLAAVQRDIDAATAALAQTRDLRKAEGTRLDGERAEHARLVAVLDAELADQAARIATLGKDEEALNTLLLRLRDLFADLPRQLAGDRPFASLRRQLPWPLKGKLLRGFGAADGDGRTTTGLVLAATPGTAVRAVSHGRVAFADWLRGYGLMIIVDHGDGYLSLYGGNEALMKEVGDWVAGGDTLATSGASGEQKSPALYFELRAKGQPIDPRGWLR